MPAWGVFSQKKKKQSQEGQQAELAEQLFSTAGEYGLKTVAEANQDTVDIVFVHGLTGNRETTWTYNESLFWPRDLLAKELPNTRILTFGYDADIVGVLKTAGSNTIRDHGKSLAQDLSMRRTRTHSNDRPIIFVAHSLGGLVVEQALLIARGSSEPHVKPLLHNTAAIAFMGTPHLGSRKADWAHSIARLSNLLRKTNKEIVAVLQPGSEILADLQQEFHTMLEDRRRNEGKWIAIFCFYEELSYSGIGQIVPRESSILPGYPNISIHNNHSDMTKFSGELDSGYIRVRDQLWLWIEAMNKNKEGVSTVSEQSQAQTQDTPQDRSAVASSGGAIFMGNVSAGRDFTYNSN